jgi:predicted nucleic acid-binding protein
VAELFGLDSNVLIYAVDNRFPDRQDRAQGIIQRAARTGRCVLATQNVGEFFHAVTRKRLGDPATALRKARELLVMFPTLQAPDAAAIRMALDATATGRFAYWDALLLATLGRAGCTALLSEDMQDGSSLAGVTVRNPFVGDDLPRAVADLLV